jgi:hypothetical protein
MQPAEVMVPLAMFACIFGIMYVYLMTRNRERLALIEKGGDPAQFRIKPRGGRNTLKFGLLFVGLAIGIMMGEILHVTIPGLREEPANFSMIFLFGGLALVLSHILDAKAAKTEIPHKDPLS